MKKIFFAAVIFTVCFTTKVAAQNDGGMKAWQDYMTPGDVHKMIAKYDGTWNEDVSFWMKPGAPATKSTSVAVNEMILGGRYQKCTITGNMMGTPFQGFSLLGYDNAKKIFTSIWIDNFGTGTLSMDGTWDEASKTITFTGKEFDPMSGKDMSVKETMQFVDDDTEKYDMYSESAAGEMKMMEIIMKRAK